MFPGIEIMMRSTYEQMLASEGVANVVTAVLHWREITRPPGYDPNDESSAAETVVADLTLEFRALFHQVDHRLSGYQRYLEIQTGDVMLDYLDDLSLADKADHRVVVNGRHYVQKSASKELLETWDVQMGSGGLLRTLLLTPAP